jgi:hypothetical protein
MARATSKSQLLEEIAHERPKLDELLDSIPAGRKLEEGADGLSVKDLLAHRTEWVGCNFAGTSRRDSGDPQRRFRREPRRRYEPVGARVMGDPTTIDGTGNGGGNTSVRSQGTSNWSIGPSWMEFARRMIGSALPARSSAPIRSGSER